ncbi:hypothetical protein VNO77_29034 [Canavalia gladiata]|uniref:Uncharacterized protein n=1 Tax=Canavalia gladiata TaxID=3824 RepID=A0AAN9KZE6_CANGL
MSCDYYFFHAKFGTELLIQFSVRLYIQSQKILVDATDQLIIPSIVYVIYAENWHREPFCKLIQLKSGRIHGLPSLLMAFPPLDILATK